MADTLPSTVAPDAGLDREVTPNIQKMQFGDGYSQRLTNGLNSKPVKTEFNWSYLTEVQMKVYDDFAKAHASGEAWLFQFPDEDAPRAFFITKWRVKRVQYNVYTVTYSVEEVFDVIV